MKQSRFALISLLSLVACGPGSSNSILDQKTTLREVTDEQTLDEITNAANFPQFETSEEECPDVSGLYEVDRKMNGDPKWTILGVRAEIRQRECKLAALQTTQAGKVERIKLFAGRTVVYEESPGVYRAIHMRMNKFDIKLYEFEYHRERPNAAFNRKISIVTKGTSTVNVNIYWVGEDWKYTEGSYAFKLSLRKP